METVHRLVGDAVLKAQDSPVIILEGPRAVGKTTLARAQLQEVGYSYTTLADRSTLAFAREDVDGWLERLQLPAIIDEAQLLPELPLAVKEKVDRLPSGNHFVLTGSSSIGRRGLGGADPLAGRVTRFVMHPLTGWELSGLQGSVAEVLSNAEIHPTVLPPLEDEQLLAAMAYGGFPDYVLQQSKMSRKRLSDRIRSDTLSVLSLSALPDMAINPTIATETLAALTRTPGGILNASRLARTLDIDKRTVGRYVGVFARLFLIHWLPNLAIRATVQTHARAKIHPIDTSLSVEALESAGVDIEQTREVFGQLLESHVVNQIVASTSWADEGVQCFYWRTSSTPIHEVDLVLDVRGGKRVGIEVKAATRVGPSDLKGLRALREAKGMTRGFVFYTGDQVQEVDESIWCIPVAALHTSGWFRTVS